MYKFRSCLVSNLALISIMSSLTLAPAVAQEPTVAWDEETSGDLSNDFTKPTVIVVSEPGEYVLRAATGPVVPERLDQPRQVNPGGTQNPRWAMADTNGDGRLQRSEVGPLPNQRIHFDIYDINGDGELTQEETAQFTLGGDGHDVFTFSQAPGINLVGIRVTHFDSGGPDNDMTVLAIIDTDETGRHFEAAGVDFVDDESLIDKIVTQDMIVGVVKPDPDGGTEIYDEYDLWKFYRRNDDSVVWRIGEGQAKALSEFVFVFE